MNIQLYTKVTYSGYPATVVEICTGKISGMVVIALPGGRACVGISELEITP